MAKAEIYTYKGFTGTLKEIIEHFDLDIQRATLQWRLSNGMRIEKAIETPLRYEAYIYKGFKGSLKEIIRHFNLNINYGTFKDRLRKGMTIEEAIEAPVNNSSKAKIYTYKGFTGNLKEIIKHFNLSINYDTLQGRLYNGMTIEEAIETPITNNKAKIYTYKNFTGTLKEIYEHFNLSINYKTLQNRLRKGMTIEEAIEAPVNNSSKAKIYTYKGFTGTLKEIIKHFNLSINYDTLQGRLYKGMSIEEAIETTIDKIPKAKIYTYKGFTGTLKEIYEHFDLNINYKTLQNRLYNGMTIEEAIETTIDKIPKAKIYTYKGFTGTLREIYEHFDLNINYKTLQGRLYNGMTIEETIETPITNNKAKIYTYKDLVGTSKEIIEHFGLDIKYRTLQNRLSKDMNIEEAICKTFYSKEYVRKLKNLCNQYNVDFIELVNKLDEVPYKEGKIIEIIKEL